MLRELKTNEMEMVSGGGDEIIVTGTRVTRNTDGWYSIDPNSVEGMQLEQMMSEAAMAEMMQQLNYSLADISIGDLADINISATVDESNTVAATVTVVSETNVTESTTITFSAAATGDTEGNVSWNAGVEVTHTF